MRFRSRSRPSYVLAVCFTFVMALAACGGGRSTPTPTATATPAPTATPMPTNTPMPATDDEADTAASDQSEQATPQVTIPEGYEVFEDSTRGYSLALPDDWTILDLRSGNFQRMAGTVGLGDQLAPLNALLDSPEGEAIGIVAATDLGGMIFGGMPSILNVSVIDAPGNDPAAVASAVETMLRDNSGALGDVTFEGVEATTVNNLPAVHGNATFDLSNVGMDAEFFVDVTGLLANEKVYVLTLATATNAREKNAAEFEAITGSFQPQ